MNIKYINEPRSRLTTRQSNIELFRFIAAILVIFWHQGVHEPYFNEITSLYSATWLFHIFQPFLIIPVSLFAFLSGYFMIDSNHPTKTFFRFLVQIIIYLAVLFILWGIIKGANPDLANRINPTRDWWYVFTIIIIYLLSPFFIFGFNKINKWFILFVIIVLYFLILIPQFSVLGLSGNSLFWLLLMFLLGAWINRYAFSLLECKWFKFGSLIFIVLIWIANLVMNAIPFGDRWGYPGNHIKFVMPFLVIACFALIRSINIPNNKFINYLGKLSFPMYLFHALFEVLIATMLHSFTIQANLEITLIVNLIIVCIITIIAGIPLMYANDQLTIWVQKIINVGYQKLRVNIKKHTK